MRELYPRRIRKVCLLPANRRMGCVMVLRRLSTGQRLLFVARFQSRCSKKKRKRAATWRQHLHASDRLASLSTKRADRRRQAWERVGEEEEQRALRFRATTLLSRRCPIARCHPRLFLPLAITNTSLWSLSLCAALLAERACTCVLACYVSRKDNSSEGPSREPCTSGSPSLSILGALG